MLLNGFWFHALLKWRLVLTDVNPFEDLLGLGGQISSLEELIDRYVKLEFIVYQLRVRTGGDVDIIESVTNTETYETSFGTGEYQERFGDYDQIESDIPVFEPPEQDEADYNPVKEWESVKPSQNYTAVDKDIVELVSGLTVILDSKADNGAQIITGNGDGSSVVVDGNGVELRYKGKRSNSIIIRNEGTFIHWYKFITPTEEYWRGS